MNILHVESSLNWGGQEYRTLKETTWLNSSGHQAWIACNPGSELRRRAPEVCLPVRMRNSFDAPACAALARHCRQRAVDVVHVHSPKDAWICYPLHAAGIPVVRSRQITNPVKRKWSRSVVYRRGCARVIATAECIRRDLIARNGVSPGRIVVIGEGVDTREFRMDVDGSVLRAEFGVPQGAALFGVVAMIRPEKGHHVFLDAAVEVLATHPETRFAIVGEGTGGRETEREVRSRLRARFGTETAGPIFMTGYRADTPVVMAALDVLVVPSTAEAQSLVVPQAFAAGRAVIASEVGGLPELVQAEVNGLLVPPGDAGALAGAMRKLARDPAHRARLGRAGREYALQHLSFDRKMAESLAVYGEVAAPRRRKARRAPPSVQGELIPFPAPTRRARHRFRHVQGLAAAALVLWLTLRDDITQFTNVLEHLGRAETTAPAQIRSAVPGLAALPGGALVDEEDDDDFPLLPVDDDDVLT